MYVSIRSGCTYIAPNLSALQSLLTPTKLFVVEIPWMKMRMTKILTTKIFRSFLRPSWLALPCSFTACLDGTQSTLIVNHPKNCTQSWDISTIFPPHVSPMPQFIYAIKKLIAARIGMSLSSATMPRCCVRFICVV